MSVDTAPNLLESKLYLRNITSDHYISLSMTDEQKCYQFLWIVNNYKKIEFGIEYTCHCIRIDEKNCFLKIKRTIDKYTTASGDKKKLAVKLDLKFYPSYVDIKFKFKNYSENCHNGSCEESPLLTPNGRLEVNFDIILFYNVTKGAIPDLYLPLLETEQTHKVDNDMDEMFSAGLFTDLSIHVFEKIFNVHRIILATRSKVFETMLKANMKEKHEKKIVITDCESESFGEFLRYVYSNKLNLSDVKTAIELYKLAEKYGLPDLKLDSSVFLARNLIPYNVIQVHKLADLHQDPKLKESTLDYMSRNLMEVLKSPAWLLFRSATGYVEELLLTVGKLVSENRYFDDFRPKK